MADTDYKASLHEALILLRNHSAGAIPRYTVSDFITRHMDGQTDGLMMTYGNIVVSVRHLLDLIGVEDREQGRGSLHFDSGEIFPILFRLRKDLKTLDRQLKGEKGD